MNADSQDLSGPFMLFFPLVPTLCVGPRGKGSVRRDGIVPHQRAPEALGRLDPAYSESAETYAVLRAFVLVIRATNPLTGAGDRNHNKGNTQ